MTTNWSSTKVSKQKEAMTGAFEYFRNCMKHSILSTLSPKRTSLTKDKSRIPTTRNCAGENADFYLGGNCSPEHPRNGMVKFKETQLFPYFLCNRFLTSDNCHEVSVKCLPCTPTCFRTLTPRRVAKSGSGAKQDTVFSFNQSNTSTSCIHHDNHEPIFF